MFYRVYEDIIIFALLISIYKTYIKIINKIISISWRVPSRNQSSKRVCNENELVRSYYKYRHHILVLVFYTVWSWKPKIVGENCKGTVQPSF